MFIKNKFYYLIKYIWILLDYKLDQIVPVTVPVDLNNFSNPFMPGIETIS
jgi:hypothetical protein